MDYSKQIISYLSGNDLRYGVVVKQHQNKLQIQDAQGRTARVAPRQLVAAHGRGAAGTAAQAIEQIRQAVEKATTDVDTGLLWESVGDDSGDREVAELAEEYFGEFRPLDSAALTSALVRDPAHFQRTGVSTFSRRTAEEVQEYLEQQRRDAEKAALRERALQWVKDVRRSTADPAPVPEELEPFVGQVEAFILMGHNTDAAKILTEAASKSAARETGVELLQRTGRIPENADMFMLLHGIFPGFPKSLIQHTDDLPSYTEDPTRTDYSQLPVFSIDDSDTEEIDDALSVEVDGDETIVGIHLADPAAFVTKGDPADRIAADRTLTLYLPTATVTMFPERLGCDLASLNQDELRPTMSFSVRLGPDGDVRDWTFGRGQVRVRYRLNYEEADAILAGQEHPLAENLRRLPALTDGLCRQREEKGAFRLGRPEIKVRVNDGEISVKRLNTEGPSRQLIGELMILANGLSALYALRNDVPIIYRVQPRPKTPIKTMTDYDPIAFEREIRKIQRTRLSTLAEPHGALGLDVYTQVSSPLRRYADLVIQRQLGAHLAGAPLPYTIQELLEVLSTAETTAGENKTLERDASRHWLLEYLSRQPEDSRYEAIVVRGDGRHPAAELCEFCLRGQLSTLAKHKPGDRVTVRLAKVRPKTGFLIMEEIACE